MEMMMLRQNWMYRLVLFIVIIFGISACAGYPSGPRNPEPGDDNYTVKEDGFLPVNAEDGILANDRPREGANNILDTVGKFKTEGGGQLDLADDGSFTYKPKANFNGQDHFTYTISNDKGKSSDGVMTITVTAVNDPPQPVDDKQDISIKHPATIDVLANDKDIDGDPLQISKVGKPNSGSVAIQDSQVVYTPAPNHSGIVSFKYTVSDGNGETADASVFLTLTDANNGITLRPDTITVNEDSTTTVPVSQLLANDTGDGLTVTALGEPQHGTAVLSGANFTYTPSADFAGTDIFIYNVRSSNGNTASSTVTATVINQPDPPTISAIEDQTTTPGTMTGPISFTVEDLDTPVANLDITAAVSNAAPPNLVIPSNITISGTTENRAIRIRPTGQLTGSATITITVSDGTSTASESFILTVASPTPTPTPPPSRAAPTISRFTNYTTERNTALTLDFSVADRDTYPLYLIVTATSGNQTVIPNSNLALVGERNNRTITITPARDQLGTTTITINVSDGTNTTTVSFQVEVVEAGGSGNDSSAPRISTIDDPQRATLNRPLTINFSLGDNDTYPLYLTVTATSNNQRVVPNANLVPGGERNLRSLTITPTAVGTATITISVSDGRNVTNRSFQLIVTASVSAVRNFNVSTNSVVALSSSRTSLLTKSAVTLAEDDVYTTIEDTPLTVATDKGVLINDRETTGASFRVTSTAIQTSHYGGEVQLKAAGGFRYMPPKNFSGEDNFQYTISPAGDTGKSDLGTVYMTVTAVNDKPLAENDLYSVAAGDRLVVAADQGVLANDRDVEGMPLQVTAMNNSSLKLNQDGSFIYTPSNKSSGKEIVTYHVSDGYRRATATLTIKIDDNPAPVVQQDEYSISRRMTLKLNRTNGLLANDSDPEGESLTIAETGVFDSLFGGEVNIGPKGGFTYSPPPNFNGVDSFIYTATDGSNSVAAVANIRVSP
jgi:hypothetical protein